MLDGRDVLTIGDHVDIASEVMIYNSQHDLNEEDFAHPEKVVEAPVEIGVRVRFYSRYLSPWADQGKRRGAALMD